MNTLIGFLIFAGVVTVAVIGFKAFTKWNDARPRSHPPSSGGGSGGGGDIEQDPVQ